MMNNKRPRASFRSSSADLDTPSQPDGTSADWHLEEEGNSPSTWGVSWGRLLSALG